MRRIAVRFFLLNKRLYKKFSFLLILCLVPALVGGMWLGAREDSGILKIALCLQNPEDELSAEIVEQFMEDSGVLRYVCCGTEGEARELVESGRADAAWIFPEDMGAAVGEAASQKKAAPIVTIVERENTVVLMFAREILTSALYPLFSYRIYEDFVREDCELPEISDRELREAYERTLREGSLFQMEYLDGQIQEETDNYLLTPVRGILSLWLVLCGFAAAMYFMQDEQGGTFSGMSAWHRLWLSFGMQGVLLCNGVAVLLLACRLAGVFTRLSGELVSAVLFACCIAAFCNLFRLLCRRLEWLGSCIPMLMMGMLFLCPVFISVRGWQAIQYLLPPYYYLKSIHSAFYLYGMACYTAVLAVLCILLYWWQNRYPGGKERGIGHSGFQHNDKMTKEEGEMAFFDKKETKPASAPSEVTVCQRQIAELEQRRAEVLRQIGQLFMENNTLEELKGSPYEEKVQAVVNLDKERAYQEKRMLAVQGKRKCEKCGNILVLESAFCNLCGEKLEPLFAQEKENRNVCPQCGTACVEGALYCPSCGQKLG